MLVQFRHILLITLFPIVFFVVVERRGESFVIFNVLLTCSFLEEICGLREGMQALSQIGMHMSKETKAWRALAWHRSSPVQLPLVLDSGQLSFCAFA